MLIYKVVTVFTIGLKKKLLNRLFYYFRFLTISIYLTNYLLFNLCISHFSFVKWGKTLYVFVRIRVCKKVPGIKKVVNTLSTIKHQLIFLYLRVVGEFVKGKRMERSYRTPYFPAFIISRNDL